MPKLVKINSVSNDDWLVVEDELTSAASISERSLISLASALAFADALPSDCGVWLKSDDDVTTLKPILSKLAVVALRFEAFADGRSFSQARILREQMEFVGEIRATGYFIQDQMFYLARCGVTEFSVEDDANIESLLESLSDISESYQAACDVAEPLFRRRA